MATPLTEEQIQQAIGAVNMPIKETLEVSEETARAFIQTGLAGYYAIDAQEVKVHPEQTVVRAEERYFIVPASELTVQFVGIMETPFGTKAAHTISLDDSHFLVPMFQRDVQRLGKSLEQIAQEKGIEN